MGQDVVHLAGRAYLLPGMGAAGRLTVAADGDDGCSGNDTW